MTRTLPPHSWLQVDPPCTAQLTPGSDKRRLYSPQSFNINNSVRKNESKCKKMAAYKMKSKRFNSTKTFFQLKHRSDWLSKSGYLFVLLTRVANKNCSCCENKNATRARKNGNERIYRKRIFAKSRIEIEILA